MHRASPRLPVLPVPPVRSARFVRSVPPVRSVLLSLVVAAASLGAPAGAAVTAYRISDMDLRDPHMYISFLGCRDVTDSPLFGFSFNGQTQADLQTDSGGDGLLDQSMVFLFDSVDPAGSGGTVLFGDASCTAPFPSTNCGPAPGGNWTVLSTTQQLAGACLSPLAGTLRPYSPSVTTSSPPCFVSAPANVVLSLGGGIPLSLTSAQFAATFVGNPPTQLVNGLLRGFLSEAVANATVLPTSFPLVGGQRLSALWPGGAPPGGSACCAAHSDKDAAPGGGFGWWMYFNFTATPVPYSGGPLAVPDAAQRSGRLDVSPNPAFGSVTVAFEVAGDHPVRVSIHDLMGRRIRDLESGPFSPGGYRTTWDGRTAAGDAAPAGLYLVRYAGGGQESSRRFMLVR